MKRRTKIFVGLALLAIGGLALGARFLVTQLVWVESEPYEREARGPAQTLVVHYSRTGNTRGAAFEAARYFEADMLQIEAPQYGLTLAGQRLAAQHADEHRRTTPIQHHPVDLSDYDLVVLCSPTWWYRPAVPLWSFVENHDFGGASVFLVMTGNSRLQQPHIDAFASLVEEQNGVFIGNVFVRRGRFFWQKTPDEVRAEVRDALLAREAQWPVSARTP